MRHLLLVALGLLFAATTCLGSWSSEFHPQVRRRELLQIVRGTLDETPRRDLSGNEVNHNFCAQDSEGNCQWQEYAEAMGMLAVPGLALAFLSFVALPGFFIMRFGCNLWGGRRRSPGVFFGGYPGDTGVCWNNDEDDFKEYNTSQILYLRLALFLCFLLIIVLSVIGFFGNRSFDDSVHTLGDTVVDTANTIIARTSELSDDLKRLPHTSSLSAELDAMVSSVQGYSEQATTVRERAYEYNQYRSAFSLLCFILPMLVMVGGCVGSVANFKALVFTMGISCFIASTFCWLSFAVTWPMTTVVLDVCNELDVYLQDPNSRGTASGANITASNSTAVGNASLSTTGFVSGSSSGGFDFSNPGGGGNPVEVILKCGKGEFFLGAEQAATNSLQSAMDAACSSVSGVCFTAPNNCTVGACSVSTLPQYKQLVVYDYLEGCYNTATGTWVNPLNPCQAGPCVGATVELRPCQSWTTTIQNCSLSCNSSYLRNLSSVFVTNVDLLGDYHSILVDQIFPLLDCTFVYTAFETIHAAMCDSTTQGIDAMCTVSMLLGIVLVPTTFFLFMGRKRFRRPLHEDLAEDLNIGKKYADQEERHWNGYEFEDVKGKAYTST